MIMNSCMSNYCPHGSAFRIFIIAQGVPSHYNPEVAIQGISNSMAVACRLQETPEDCIGAEPRLILRSVQFPHDRINIRLIHRVKAHKFGAISCITLFTALSTPFPWNRVPPSLSSSASVLRGCPDGTAALPRARCQETLLKSGFPSNPVFHGIDFNNLSHVPSLSLV